MDRDPFRKYCSSFRRTLFVVCLKTLVVESELVSLEKGVVKSAEEFQMSELHIHELQAPVAMLSSCSI